MTIKKLFLLLFFVIMTISCKEQQSTSKNELLVNHARSKCIELNKKHNQLFDAVAKQYMLYGDAEWKYAAMCLQELTKEIMEVNKALDIDCYKYDENGNLIMVQDEKGNKQPTEILPEELKIIYY